ncbi:Adenylate-forming reductase 03009 [Linum perenne]
MMLCGVVGDFTKSLVSNPPTHFWVRQVHFAGLPYLVNMYDRVLLVATRSGICVFLSFLLQPCRANVCLVWVAKGIEHNFGQEIKEMMSRHPQDKVVVHDTGSMVRPNVSQMSVKIAKKWGAEVVIVTSNPEGSRDNHHDETTFPRVVKRSSIASSDFPSSHFCDLDLDEEVGVVNVFLARLEEGKFEGEREKEQQQQPPKSSSRLSIILLDQGLFTVYKQLFAVSFTLNAVGLVTVATGNFDYGRNRAALFSIGNIFALTLCRSEVCLLPVFWAAVRLLGPTWVPIQVKTSAMSFLQSLGGIHIGCGVSSVVWLIYSLVLGLMNRAITSLENIIVAWVILSLISLSCLVAFPLV